MPSGADLNPFRREGIACGCDSVRFSGRIGRVVVSPASKLGSHALFSWASQGQAWASLDLDLHLLKICFFFFFFFFFFFPVGFNMTTGHVYICPRGLNQKVPDGCAG